MTSSDADLGKYLNFIDDSMSAGRLKCIMYSIDTVMETNGSENGEWTEYEIESAAVLVTLEQCEKLTFSIQAQE